MVGAREDVRALRVAQVREREPAQVFARGHAVVARGAGISRRIPATIALPPWSRARWRPRARSRASGRRTRAPRSPRASRRASRSTGTRPTCAPRATGSRRRRARRAAVASVGGQSGLMQSPRALRERVAPRRGRLRGVRVLPLRAPPGRRFPVVARCAKVHGDVEE